MELDERVAIKYLSLKESSKAHGLEFGMTLQSLKNIYRAKRCYYTGVPLNNRVGDDNRLTIDRKDASVGYVPGNVVACSQRFNQLKGALTVSDIKLLHKKLVGDKL